MSRETPEQVLKSIVDGINAGDLNALTSLYEPEAAFAAQPGSLAHGPQGVREALAGFFAMKGTLELKVTRALSQAIWPSSRRFGHSLERGRTANR